MATSEYDIWWNHLVVKGYIMVFPSTEGSLSPSHENFGKDLSFLVTTYLSENQNSSSTFYQKISPKTAVMGHSMGGGCTYLAAGSSINTDNNITTIVTLAAANTNPSSITAATTLSMPSLTVAGSEDCVVTASGGPDDIYASTIASPYKAFVNITGATHCNFGKNSAFSFCDIGETCSGSITKTEQHTRMFATVTPWLDYYLKMDCPSWTTFHSYMTSNPTLHTYQESGVTPLPVSLTVDQSGNNLTANPNSGYSYQWLKEGVSIAGATASAYTATISGDYTVMVTDGYGCTKVSSNIVSALPIDLVGVDAIYLGKDEAKITWTVNNEINVKEYILQYSKNGDDFIDVNAVAARNSESETYSLLDQHCTRGVNYYRIQSIDFDGKFSFLPQVSVFATSPAISILISSPVFDALNINIQSESIDEGNLVVYDALGKLIISQNITLNIGENKLSIPFGYPSGQYFITWKGMKYSKTHKMVK